tara:strand:+ start:57826 stop:59280 length:1455 start_codon:yes stop_codon:yes gene_type:complete
VALKNTYLFAAGLLLLSACQTKPQTEEQETPTKPNIVIIFTDDQGYNDVGVFGAKGFNTPNLDQMAKEGAQLTNFYVAQAVCSASRAALLTGCYSNRVSIHNALGPESKIGLNPDETTLAEVLKAEGYATAIYGKWHLGDEPEFMPTRQGFDEYFGIPYSGDMWPNHPWQGTVFNFPPLPLYENETIIDTLEGQSQLTTQLTEHAVDFIKRNKDKPFFLYVPHPQPHVPLFVSDKFKGKSERGLYGDVIMEIDWSVGQILAALKENGLDDNTLVIFTSDNGPWLSYGGHAGSAYPLREGKGTSWEGGIREPAIMRFPGKIPAGSVINTPMMTIDLLPTIAKLAGGTMPEKTIDGKDVWPILTGQTKDSPHEAYFIYYRVNELQAVRSGKWKLYLPHTYRTLNGHEGTNDGLPIDYEQAEVTKPELYDLDADMEETADVAAANPEVVDRLLKLADGMRAKLGDSIRGVEGTENREPGRVSREDQE